MSLHPRKIEIPSAVWMVILLLISYDLVCQDEPAFAINQIDPILLKNAAVVIRYDETFIELIDQDEIKTRYRQISSILNKSGAQFGDLRISYKQGTEKIDNIVYKVYDKDGHLIKEIKERQVDDYASSEGGSFISDGRFKSYDYEANAYPITIDKSWTKSSKSTLILPIWVPLPATNVSVESSLYQIENKTNIPVVTGKRNFEKYNIDQIGDYKYKMTNQPVIKSEAYSPNIYDVYPILYTRPRSFVYEGYSGSYDNWEELGRWVHDKLLAEKFDLDAEVVRRDLAAVIDADLDDVEIVRRLYQYIQENTRYVFIGLDEGGYVPLSNSKVHEVKYGDCKALSFYMKGLLDVYDIPSNYVIIKSGTSKPIDIFPEYPSTIPADHVILNVPIEGDTIWLDCTSQNNPFNYLGDFTDDRIALQVNEQGGSLVRTPAYTKEQNRRAITATVKFERDGSITAGVDIDHHGLQMDFGYWLRDLGEKKKLEYVEMDRFDYLDQLSVSHQEFDIDEDQLVTKEHYDLSAYRYGEIAGDYLLFKASFVPMAVPRLKKDSRRVNDIYFPRSKEYSSDVVYTLPEGYRMRVPKDVILESPYGNFERSVKMDDQGNVKISELFSLNKGRYPNSEYAEIKKFFDKVRKSVRTKLSASNKS